jgi:hypothetical protein
LTHESESTPYLHWLRAVRPGTSIRILPQAGHFSMLERAEAVTVLLRDFARDAHIEGSG